MLAARRTSYPKLLNRDFSAETGASGAVTDAIYETLAQLLVPEQNSIPVALVEIHSYVIP